MSGTELDGRKGGVAGGVSSDPTTPMLNLSNRSDTNASGGKSRIYGTGGGASSVVQRRKRRSVMLFERASSKWWNPQFASRSLEHQYWKNNFPQLRSRFRWGLGYIAVTAVVWWIFRVSELPWEQILVHQLGAIAVVLVTLALLAFTFSRHYVRFHLPTSFITAFLVCVLSLLYCSVSPPVLSPVAAFASSVEVVLILYTVIPMPLYLCIISGLVYSVLYEVIRNQWNSDEIAIVKLCLHLCVHIIGIHIFLVTQVRTRKTFLKVGESLMARRDLTVEAWIKEKMIESVMPLKVAEELMGESTEIMRRPSSAGKIKYSTKPAPGLADCQPTKGSTVAFRPFTMNLMSNVSILFADIAGFTKMSSNKRADELVDLLNDLFGRFDRLCSQSGCEKISTLGDCYYCVAGCPEPKDDHAICCVEMGLGMIVAIKQFDLDRGQEVNMRVGVHTGTVMCGIVGTKRFKFDVFSNDVSLANTMESSGQAGRVHISEATASFLDNHYEMEEGDVVEGMRTFFILRRKTDQPAPKLSPVCDQCDGVLNIGLTGSGELPDWCQQENLRHIDSTELESEMEDRAHTGLMKKGNKNHSNMGISASQGATGSRNSLRTHLLTNQLCSSAPTQKKIDSTQVSKSITSGPDHIDTNKDLAELVSEAHGHTHSGVGVESLISGHMSRLDDRTDRRLADCWKEADGPLLTRSEKLDRWTLRFRDAKVERFYQSHFARRNSTESTKSDLDEKGEKEERERRRTRVSAPKYSVLIDTFVGTFVFLIISILAFVVFGARLAWSIYFGLTTVSLLVFLTVLFWYLFRHHALLPVLTMWTPRHLIGILCIELPLGAALTNIYCHSTVGPSDSSSVEGSHELILSYMVIVLLFAHCNFSQLTNWAKSLLATFIGIALVVLVNVCLCGDCATSPSTLNGTLVESTTLPPFANQTHMYPLFSGQSPLRKEMILDVLLALILIWFLNRQFEAIFRMSFYGDWQSVQDIEKMQVVKEQADWLLGNIIPTHVLEVVRNESRYSENHNLVPVLFASIVNWTDMYEETYEGGREFLRVLNEVIGDFDELLDRPEFNQVEKIKTIGPTYMAASGLNTEKRRLAADPNEHLYQLMDFAIALQETLDNFNKDLLNFEFKMKIGYNIGPVTAGVIGTTKLYYDIWGDTVNIASRMYSTGLKGRIQVSDHVRTILKDVYNFEFRAHIDVKGIDSGMDVHLVAGKKPNAVGTIVNSAEDNNNPAVGGR